MREVAPGDLILSFKDTYVLAAGVARSYCYECPKPEEFGSAGQNWEKIGWKVDVSYYPLKNKIRPKDHMAQLAPLLPAKYAPLRHNGDGLQSVYLTELQEPLARTLAALVGREIQDLMFEGGLKLADDELTPIQAPATGLVAWEEYLKTKIEQDIKIPETDRQAIIIARRGQGRYKENVARLERFCRLTQVDRLEHLRASHLKPWRDSSNDERMDGENGLLLTPTMDHLVDRGFISFENTGELLISPVAHTPSLEKMGVPVKSKTNVGKFSEGQRKYLEYHRENVFLRRG